MKIYDEYFKLIKNIELKDRNNPLSLLAENMAASLVDSNKLRIENDKIIYPFLADSTEQLLTHINYKDEDGMFALPATTYIMLTINLNDFISNSVETNGKYKMTLAKRSIIEVDNFTFMVNRDINIEVGIYNQNNVNRFIPFVHLGDTAVVDVVDDKGVIPSNIFYDDSNVAYIAFEVPVVESKVLITTARVITDDISEIEVEFKGQYIKSIIEIKRNGVWEEVKKFYSYSKLIDTKAVHVRVSDNKVYYTVDKDSSSIINGDMRIVTITCSGRLFLDLNEFKSKDYKLTVFDSKFNVMNSLYSNRIVNSGKNRLSLRALKTKIINRSFDIKQLPITKYDVTDRIRSLGLVGTTHSSSLLGRVFAARGDLFSTTNIIPRSHYLKYSYNPTDTSIVQTVDDNIIILESTYFKYVNDVLTPVPQSEIVDIKKDLTLLKTPYYKTPYRYILNSLTSSTSKVYQCNRPVVNSITITSKNTELKENCNINKTDVKREGNGYRVFFKVLGNQDYELIKADVSIDVILNSTGGTIDFKAVVDNVKNIDYFGVANGYYSFFIDLSLIIKDNKLKVLNGVSTLADKPIDLSGEMECIIRYKDKTLPTTPAGISYYAKAIGFAKHVIKYTFVKEVKNIIAESTVNLTNKRYKTYAADVYETYPNDVYQYNANIGGSFTVVDQDNDGKGDVIQRTKLHSMGDVVLDVNGNQIIKHAKGDVIKVNDIPVIDKTFGKSAVLYLTLIDGIFDFVNERLNDRLKTELSTDIIDDIVFNKLDKINDSILEKSKVKFLPWLTESKVKSTSGDSYDRYLKPDVKLYFSKGSDVTINTLSDVLKQVNTEISKSISKLVIDVNGLEQHIEKIIGNGILSVDITGIPRTMKLDVDSNRFILPLTITNGNEVKYDVQHTIVKI